MKCSTGLKLNAKAASIQAGLHAANIQYRPTFVRKNTT